MVEPEHVDEPGTFDPVKVPTYVRLGSTRLALVLLGARLNELQLAPKVQRHLELLVGDGPWGPALPGPPRRD